ncbi:MAG TPA: hypothetical protein DIW44_14800 [Anaerolineaceae bacterium]|nr:hypothetical protein [Anaerolineaceae bacterium]
MKRSRLLKFRIMLIVLVGIAACAPTTIETQPASVAVTEEVATVIVETQTIMPSGETTATETPVSETQVTETPAADVEALILEKLQNHHSIARVYAVSKTREEWNITLDRMIGYGAKISEEEKQIIIDYLLSR